MILTSEKFLKELEKNGTSTCFVLAVGEEGFYKDLLVRRITEKVFEGVAETDRSIVRYSKNIDFSALQESINTYPFFSGKNLVILDNPTILGNDKKGDEEKRKAMQGKLLEILLDVPDYTQVVCLCDVLDKRRKFYTASADKGTVVLCDSIKPFALKPWLDAQADSFGARFEPRAAALIAEYMSVVDTVPLLILRQEMEKLALYAGERKLWKAADVEEVFSSLPEVSRFALSNAVVQRKLGRALELLAAEKKKGESNFLGVCFRLGFEIRRLCQVSELLQEGLRRNEIASRLKMNPYGCEIAMRSAGSFTVQELRRCLVQLNALNVEKRKGGRGYERLEEIIMELLSKRVS